MRKAILEHIERILSTALSTFSCLGMFLTGNLIWNLASDSELSYGVMLAIFLGCIILTYAGNTILLNVKYAKLEIMADELEKEEMMKKGEK